jgi:hypothetical protein
VPSADAESGDSIRLPLGGLDFDSDCFMTLEGLSDYNSAVVPVLVDDGEKTIRVAGSAFNIHPLGLWVTARHVIDDAYRKRPDAHIRLMWTEPGESTGAPPSWLDSEEDVPDAPFRRAIFLPVTASIRDSANGSDLALLRAGTVNSDGQPRSFPRWRLSARVPTIGTRVRVIGHGGSEVTADTETERVRKIVLARNLSVSQGEVLEVHREGRDTYKDLDGKPTGYLATVCFDTSARIDGGMSGGPVVDRGGTVCGIASASLGAENRSTVTATPFLFPLRLPQDEPVTVYQMAEAGKVAVDGHFERLIITFDENGHGTITYPFGDDDVTDAADQQARHRASAGLTDRNPLCRLWSALRQKFFSFM